MFGGVGLGVAISALEQTSGQPLVWPYSETSSRREWEMRSV